MRDFAKRAYRMASGERLVETSLAVARHLTLDDQGRFALGDGTFVEPRTFLLFDTSGTQRAFYGHPTETPHEDSLFIASVHFVRDGVLWNAVIEIVGGQGSVSAKSAELSGLELLK